MNVDPDGHPFFLLLIRMAVSSLVMWGIGPIFDSQIAEGIGSVVNGGGAIWTGIVLCAFGTIGIALGIGLIVIGTITTAIGINEIVAGVTGNNAIRDWVVAVYMKV